MNSEQVEAVLNAGGSVKLADMDFTEGLKLVDQALHFKLGDAVAALVFPSVESVQKYMDENAATVDQETLKRVRALGVYGYQRGLTLMVVPKG